MLSRVSAVFPLKRVTDVRQRLRVAAPEAAQNQRRTTHGNIESCHERRELLKEEIPRAESKPLSQQAQGVQGTSQSRQGPDSCGQKEKKNKPYTRPPNLRAAPTNNEWQCANCGQNNCMTRKERRQCHKMPPGPSNPNPVPPKEVASGSTGHPYNLADVAKGKPDQGPDKTATQAGKASPIQRSLSRKGTRQLRTPKWPHYEKAIAALFEGCSLKDNLRAQVMALKVTLPPETRPGVRVDQATARLARAQKLETELEEKLFEVEQLCRTISWRLPLPSSKCALIPSAPTTYLGPTCITFSREQSAELQGFLLSCQKSLATDPEEKERAKRRCNQSHEATGVTQEAAQEEVHTAHKLAKLIGWVGEKLAAPNPPPPAPAPTTPHSPPTDNSVDATMKDATPSGNRPTHGAGTTGGGQPVKHQS